MPIRSWCSDGIKARRERNSEIVAPMVVPWPQVVSRTGITVLVASREEVRALAMREREDERVEVLVAPGLFCCCRVCLVRVLYPSVFLLLGFLLKGGSSSSEVTEIIIDRRVE
jgi:hypothetical protein